MHSLHIEQLSVNYDRTPVLWEINLSVPKGKLVGIIGPNGAGKSTLIKAVLGLLPKLTGKIEFFGSPLENVRQRVAYVPQRTAVDWEFPVTVRDLVMMGRYGHLGLFHRPKLADREAVERCLEKVGMEAYANRQISQLSGGQQQRAFLARALMQDAEIYFLDEPFSGIDIASETTLMHILRELRNSGKTLFVVHHDLTTVESYFDWVVMLNMRLVCCGPTLQAFNPDTLNAAYGKSYALFDEALKLSQNRTMGNEP